MSKPKWYNRYIIKHAIVCFFKGHELDQGDKWTYEPDTCSRCWLEIDDWFCTIPGYLQVIYGWFVERNWKWFENFDEWMINKFGYKLPKWWEY